MAVVSFSRLQLPVSATFRPAALRFALSLSSFQSSLKWVWNQFIRLDLSWKKAYKLIGWSFILAFFVLFVVVVVVVAVLLLLIMMMFLLLPLPLVILIFFAELEIVLCSRLSVSICNICNKSWTTEKERNEAKAEEEEEEKKKQNRNFCSKRVVLLYANETTSTLYLPSNEEKKAKSGSNVFVLTFDCILYDRLRAE